MNEFKADLHIHTVLSPCGSLEMSPVNVINHAVKKGMDIIGITDHNTTRHCELLRELGIEKGIFVLAGAEVNTREEIHCLAFFEKSIELQKFQEYLDEWLAPIKNDPDKFGDQVQVNRKDEIVYVEEKSLFASLNQSIEEVEMKVHELNGIFIPAHIDRPRNSVYSQLGFFPEGLKADAIEIFRDTDPFAFITRHPEVDGFTMIKSSDAHFPGDIARNYSIFKLRNLSFAEIMLALENSAGREVRTK
ncbi:MAG: PHP domain-containing protein [Bacteroidales bacterium]|nr:PHP domain-containing protein [Bacteroidales bacterium]